MNLMTVFLLALASPAAGPQEDDLTPAQAMELLEDAKRLMGKAEQRLSDASPDRAEKHEKDAAEMLDEVIKKARSAAGRGQQGREQQQQNQHSNKARPPGAPAKDAYDPKRADEPSKFKSVATKSGSWGTLPPKVRIILLETAKEEIPPEFLEVWRKYGRLIEDSAK